MKRGFISVSLVMILTILNIIFISLATQSLRYRASNVNSIRNREKIAYYNSYLDMDEEVLKTIFSKTLKMYTDDWEENKKRIFNEFMGKKVNFKRIDMRSIYREKGLSDYETGDIIFVKGKDLNMYFEFKRVIRTVNEGNVHLYTMYRINDIKFDDEDEKYIKEKSIESLEKKYLDRLIDDRESSIGW